MKNQELADKLLHLHLIKIQLLPIRIGGLNLRVVHLCLRQA